MRSLYILYRYITELNKDNSELSRQLLHDRFSRLVAEFNSAIFNGRDSIATHDKRTFSLHENGKEECVFFHYRRGRLIIVWKFNYCQKEVVHERQFRARNLSVAEQQEIADSMVIEIYTISEHHQDVVGASAPAKQDIAENIPSSTEP